MKYKELREKYPRFIYEKYFYKISGKNLEIFFDFRIEPSIYFKPKIIIKNIPSYAKWNLAQFDNLVSHLGLMEIPSYWKTTCSPEIIIKAGSLNREQIRWWKDLIMNGMGQFFYENKIDFRKSNFVNISTVNENGPRSYHKGSRYEDGPRNGVLVPVGGGKDSVVTLEILKKVKKELKKELSSFSLNPTEAVLKIMKISGCKKPIIVQRKIDEKLLELNRQGFLNGHTPFSAYLAFLSVLVAVIFSQKYIAFSNERSSNEGNVKYLGKIINHQWSKSFEFEQKFRNYSKKYLAKNIKYFSFLRPLYEIQIAKLFSQYPKYFDAFLSCNVAYQTVSGTKKPTKKWCGNCPKCLFVFATLYPFVNEGKLIKIFGQNLFENKKLLPVMQELIGERKFKPFECVGTKKESLIAFYLSWKKYRDRVSVKLPILLKYFEDEILNSLPRRILSISERFMRDWNNQHNLPKNFKKILQKEVSKAKRTSSSFSPSLL